MTSATLDASMTRLENIKGNKHLYNKNKIAEAEALAAEALRMANEAKMAAARLAEVKRTLSMFSNKLEKAEQSVQKDVKVIKAIPVVVKVKAVPVVAKELAADKAEEVVEKVVVVETPAEAPAQEEKQAEVPAQEEKPAENDKSDPPTSSSDVVSKNLVNDDAVKVVEIKQPSPVTSTKVLPQAPEEPVAIRETPAPVVAVEKYQHDIVEDFLDGLGIDRMCGIDDKTLGYSDDREQVAPKPKIFVNPTRLEIKTVTNEQLLHVTSFQEDEAARQRQELNLPRKQFQRSQVNEEFVDPFGVDHDDLVLCGKIADLCEPLEFDDGDYLVDINGNEVESHASVKKD